MTPKPGTAQVCDCKASRALIHILSKDDRSEIRTTEGSEEEAILRQNNEYRLRDTKLKILVSQHGGDVGRQLS